MPHPERIVATDLSYYIHGPLQGIENGNRAGKIPLPVSTARFLDRHPLGAGGCLRQCYDKRFAAGVSNRRDHLGLFFDKPTVGCAKSRLTGTFTEPSAEKGSHSDLTDGDEIIGAVVRTRTNVKPLFVSVGNKCTLEDAITVTLTCAVKYRLPEPTRLAHQSVSKIRLTL